jgi:hypothetical protein
MRSGSSFDRRIALQSSQKCADTANIRRAAGTLGKLFVAFLDGATATDRGKRLAQTR